MGNSILRGISAALLVTVITLMAGMLWTAMGFGGLTMSTLVDIGLIASCVTAGYRTGRESGQWILGGIAGLGYVILCVTILALFLEVSGWGVIQVLAEGGLIGILAGAFGAGGGNNKNRPAGSWRASERFSSWGDRSGWNSYSRNSYDKWDSHVDEWDEPDESDDKEGRSNQSIQGQSNSEKSRDEWKELKNSELRNRETWEEEVHWKEKPLARKTRKKEERFEEEYMKNKLEEDEWESWVQEERRRPTAASTSSSYRKAWWEEDVL